MASKLFKVQSLLTKYGIANEYSVRELNKYIKTLRDTHLVLAYIAFDKRCKELGCNNFLNDYMYGNIPKYIEDKQLCRAFWMELSYDNYTKAAKDYNFYYDINNTDKDSLYGRFLSPFYAREIQIRLAGFSICTHEAANCLVPMLVKDRGKKVLEIMAGNGLWSAAINSIGVKYTSAVLSIVSYATDIKVDHSIKFRQDFTYVEECDCIEAIKKYDFDYVLCSWPREDSPICEALVEMNKKNPDAMMIYIGEGYDGCCAPYEFFTDYAVDVDTVEEFGVSLDEINAGFRNWEGIHDSIFIYKCNPKML